jgi:phage tail-like protein
MPDDTLLTAFRFEVKLMRSPNSIAGTQNTDAGTPQGGGDGSSPYPDRLVASGLFQECSGLEIEMDVQEYLEGGRNNGTVRRIGRAKYLPIVLKRGMLYSGDGTINGELWLWMQRIVDGERPVARYDGVVNVMSANKTVRASWTFDRGLPAKIRGPELNGRTGEIAIEELTIAHEGLRLLPAQAPQ